MRKLSGAKDKLGLRVHGLIVGSPEKKKADPAVLRSLCSNILPNGKQEVLVSEFGSWASVQVRAGDCHRHGRLQTRAMVGCASWPSERLLQSNQSKCVHASLGLLTKSHMIECDWGSTCMHAMQADSSLGAMDWDDKEGNTRRRLVSLQREKARQEESRRLKAEQRAQNGDAGKVVARRPVAKH